MSLEKLQAKLVESDNALVESVILLNSLRGLLSTSIFDEEDNIYDLGQNVVDHWDGGYEEWIERGRVFHHQIMVATVADVLADKIGLQASEHRSLYAACLLHDSDKKREVNWQRAVAYATGEDLSGWYYDSSKILQEEDRLLGENAEDHVSALQRIVRVKDQTEEDEIYDNLIAGIPLEVNKLMHANDPYSFDGHETLVEKILWFADACVSGVAVTDIETRMKKVSNNPRKASQVKHQNGYYKEKYGIDNFYELQMHLATKYTGEFSNILEIEKEDLINYIKEEVSKRVENLELPKFI